MLHALHVHLKPRLLRRAMEQMDLWPICRERASVQVLVAKRVQLQSAVPSGMPVAAPCLSPLMRAGRLSVRDKLGTEENTHASHLGGSWAACLVGWHLSSWPRPRTHLIVRSPQGHRQRQLEQDGTEGSAQEEDM